MAAAAPQVPVAERFDGQPVAPAAHVGAPAAPAAPVTGANEPPSADAPEPAAPAETAAQADAGIPQEVLDCAAEQGPVGEDGARVGVEADAPVELPQDDVLLDDMTRETLFKRYPEIVNKSDSKGDMILKIESAAANAG